MKSIISSTPAIFLTAAALTLTSVCTLAIPSVATTPARNAIANAQKKKPQLNTNAQKKQPHRDIVAYTIQDLQKSRKRWIEINLTKQRVIAWEGSKQVYAIIVSTGKRSTPTLPGVFSIKAKYPFVNMKGDHYLVPNVPYTMYYSGFYAIHGAYWHRRFGTPVSHGCTNVAINHAKWLFNWATVGTPVIVKK